VIAVNRRFLVRVQAEEPLSQLTAITLVNNLPRPSIRPKPDACSSRSRTPTIFRLQRVAAITPDAALDIHERFDSVHWQAEDRACRIGQTRTVNVTYFVARDTIDNFVQAVLETKAALVNAIVEGDALAPGSGGDVLDELQRVLHSISSGGEVSAGDSDDDELIPQLLRRAADEFRTMHRADPHRPAAVRGEREVQALARALEGLVKVLSGPSARRFRISSASHKGVDYETWSSTLT
jgi:hypothetical protein